MYDRLFNYLELGKRVELLNKRLDIMKELLDMLGISYHNIINDYSQYHMFYGCARMSYNS
jgi:uncharacterized Rmd1/YagE family protein